MRRVSVFLLSTVFMGHFGCGVETSVDHAPIESGQPENGQEAIVPETPPPETPPPEMPPPEQQQMPRAPAMPPAPPPPAQPPPAQPMGSGLEGPWAFLLTSAQTMTFPIEGASATTVRLLAAVDAKEGANGLELNASFCDVAIEKEGLLQINFPESAIAAFPPATVKVAFEGTGITSEPVQQLVGWKADNPATDTIPERPRDKRVIDADSDGEAGISVGMRAAIIRMDLYMALRATMKVESITSLEAASVRGLTSVKLEQSILGTSGGLVGAVIPKGPVETVANPDPNLHTFRMAKLPGALSCDDLRKQADTLFP